MPASTAEAARDPTDEPTHFWLTTHWPPRGGDEYTVAGGVYLSEAHGDVGRDITPGDLVVIYQSRSGRSLVRTAMDGTIRHVPCKPGQGGVVALGRIQGAMYHDEAAETEHYTNSTAIRWSWRAPVELLSTSGFVSREALNQILGYACRYHYRGFGDQHSGLKQIREATYLAIEAAFRRSRPPTNREMDPRLHLAPVSATTRIRIPAA